MTETEFLRKHIIQVTAERDLLQDLLDSRPPINAGLPESYIRWVDRVIDRNTQREIPAPVSPSSPIGEDQVSEVAIELAVLAGKRTFEPSEAAGVLYRAATLIVIAHIPPERALNAINAMAAIARDEVADAVGCGETRQ